MRRGPAAGALAASVMAVLTAHGVFANGQGDPQDLRKLSLEELMKIEVTVATRQPEPVGTVAAAVSVVTRDDIRRSGVTTIADALTLADGVHVARLNNGSWAISARGFNGSTPNKMLVMVDGRSEYSPLFSGVFWNTLDYILDDIDRIEVIRGPGATIWGANAVNGVVNIITRSAHDTHGTLLSAGGGNEDPALLEARYGGGSGDLSYRMYGKFARRDAQQFSTGGSSADTRRRGQAGLRLDAAGAGNQYMLKADVFHSRDGFIDRRDGEWTGMAVQGRVTRRLSPVSTLQAQSFYRREYRNVEGQLTHYIDTGDIDVQHAFQATPRNHFIWGAAFRVDRDVTFGSPVIRFEPSSRVYPLLSVFAQNEFVLRPDEISVTTGLKVEHNAFSGGDWQPNVRARWVLPGRHVVWGSLARAVRRPTRVEDDILTTAQDGTLLVQGNDAFDSEAMTGGEIGYRHRPLDTVALEGVVYLQHYDRLRSQEAPLVGTVPLTIGNTLNGRSRGLVLSASVRPAGWWRVNASYTRLATRITRDADSRHVGSAGSEMNDPAFLFTVRAAFDLRRNVEFDAWVRRVGALPDPAVPAYAELNARLGWNATPKVALALIGRDLLQAQHPEAGAPTPRRIEFERSVHALLTLRLP